MRPNLVRSMLLCAAMALLAGCATTGPENKIIRTVHAFEGAGPFENILVISVAGDQRSRAVFEREMVAALADDGVNASPWFTVVGAHTPLERKTLNNALKAREYDAVLFVRELGQEVPDLAPGRPVGRGLDLLHYDYFELNREVPIDAGTTVTFVAEVYDVGAIRKIWAIESLVFDSESVVAAVSNQATIRRE